MIRGMAGELAPQTVVPEALTTVSQAVRRVTVREIRSGVDVVVLSEAAGDLSGGLVDDGHAEQFLPYAVRRTPYAVRGLGAQDAVAALEGDLQAQECGLRLPALVVELDGFGRRVCAVVKQCGDQPEF